MYLFCLVFGAFIHVYAEAQPLDTYSPQCRSTVIETTPRTQERYCKTSRYDEYGDSGDSGDYDNDADDDDDDDDDDADDDDDHDHDHDHDHGNDDGDDMLGLEMRLGIM